MMLLYAYVYQFVLFMYMYIRMCTSTYVRTYVLTTRLIIYMVPYVSRAYEVPTREGTYVRTYVHSECMIVLTEVCTYVCIRIKIE